MWARRKNTTARWLAAALAAALTLAVLSGCAAKPSPEAVTQSVADGGVFPAFEARELGGGELMRNDVFARADLTAVCLWTQECGYCPAQLETLDALAKSRADEGFQAISLLLGPADASARGDSITHLVAAPDFDTAAIMSGLRVPCTVFVDREGRILREPLVGQRDGDEMDEIITRLLAERKGRA